MKKIKAKKEEEEAVARVEEEAKEATEETVPADD
jgi:hypothetical protein